MLINEDSDFEESVKEIFSEYVGVPEEQDLEPLLKKMHKAISVSLDAHNSHAATMIAIIFRDKTEAEEDEFIRKITEHFEGDLRGKLSSVRRKGL